MIGAGAAGLVTARQLEVAGLEPIVFEAEDQPGGTWVYTDEVESDPLGVAPDRRRIHTSMYADLRTNLPRDLMAYREFPFDGRGGGEDDWPRFPTHEQVLEYLARYAKRFDLLRHIRFGTHVDALLPLDGDRAPSEDLAEEPAAWRVRFTRPGGAPVDEEFDAVAVCNGHYAFPRVPSLPGAASFRGDRLHSHNYRHPETFTGQRVVLLGARASGVDIAIEVAEHAREVFLCARGVERTQSLPGGDDVVLRPSIEKLDEVGILLTDGTRIDDVDTLLFCTGYRYRLPFLEGTDLVEVDDNWIHPLYLDLFATRAPTLGFIGLPNKIVPFPQYELQATLYARVLARLVALPERAERERETAEHLARLRAEGVAQRHFLQQGDRQFAYNDQLARRSGIEPLPRAFEDVYQSVEQARFRDLKRYRDEPLPWLDPESARRARNRYRT